MPVPDGELLCNAVLAYAQAQRQLIANLAPSDDGRVTQVAAAMTAELDQLVAALGRPTADGATPRRGDPGQ